MSYRPEYQSLERPARTILSGIKDFETSVQNRIEEGDFKNGHIAELVALGKELAVLKYTLLQLAEENW
jgi:hypothetical protein